MLCHLQLGWCTSADDVTSLFEAAATVMYQKSRHGYSHGMEYRDTCSVGIELYLGPQQRSSFPQSDIRTTEDHGVATEFRATQMRFAAQGKHIT